MIPDLSENRWIAFGILLSSVGLVVIVLLFMKKRKEKTVRSKIVSYQRFIEGNNQLLKSRLEQKDENGRRVLVTKEREEILQMEFHVMLEKLRKGVLRPITVLEAYQAKAIEATERKSCVTHFITEATSWALQLEAVPFDQRGPLYGLPFSFKECLPVAGYPSTYGLSCLLDEPSRRSSSIVEAVLALGGIPFCMTNVPQTLKSTGCSNPIFGTTRNPLDDTRTSGGSSGGEGSLIGMGGSRLGVGTDIAGSARLPAMFCGITSLKPTNFRLPELTRSSIKVDIYPCLNCNVAVIANDLAALCHTYQGILMNVDKLQKIDPLMLPIPWNEQMFSRSSKFRIGWLVESKSFEPIPGCKRALHDVVRALETDNHYTEEIPSTWIDETFKVLMDFLLIDDGARMLKLIENEMVVDSDLKVQMIAWRIPFWIRKNVLAKIVERISPLQAMIVRGGTRDGSELCQNICKAIRWKEFVLELMNSKGLDAILLPAPCVAPKLEHIPELHSIAMMTSNANVIDFPVGSMTVSKHTEEDMKDLLDHYPDDRHKNDTFYKMLKESMTGSVGLPIGIQVMARPYCEEKVLAVMKEIEKLLK